MKFKLTRDSSGRNRVPREDRVSEIEITTLEELLSFVNDENNNIIITPADSGGRHWITVDDRFKD